MAQGGGPTAGLASPPGLRRPAEVAGALSLRTAIWRRRCGVSPLDTGPTETVLALLREQLGAQGFELGFACADRACGGFDFRYALPIADAPEMHVDIGRFHYLTAARRTPQGQEHMAITLSRGGQNGYVHLAHVAPAGAPAAAVTASSSQVVPAPGAASGLIARLTSTGSAVLADVTFGTGAASLSDARVDSLVTLAAFLAENPSRRVVMVGHTDTEGSLESNIALSRVRAGAGAANVI